MSYELKIALQKLGKKRFNFALFRGDAEDIVLVTPRPPNSKLIKEAEAECGKGAKRVLKGLCFQEAEALVFASKNKPSPTFEKVIKDVLKARQCAKFLPIELRQLAETESDEVEAAEDGETEGGAPSDQAGSGPAAPAPLEAVPTTDAAPKPEPAPPAPTASDFEKVEFDALKARLFPQIKTALADPRSKEKIAPVLNQVVQQEKAGAYPGALAALKEIGVILGAPSTPPPPAPAPPSGLSAERLMEAMNKLAPVIKQVIATNPGAKDLLVKPLSEFKSQIGSDLAGAQASLTKVGEVLKSLSGTSGTSSTQPPPSTPAPSQQPPPPAPQAEPKQPEGSSKLMEEFWAVFGRLEPEYIQAVRVIGKPSPQVAELRQKINDSWNRANDAMEKDDFQTALDLLKKLAASGLLDQIVLAKAEMTLPPSGLVAKRRYLLERWTKIPGELAAALAGLAKGIAADYPDDDTAGLISGIQDHLKELLDGVQDEIDAAINSGKMESIKGLLDRQRKIIEADPIMADLMSNPFGQSGSDFINAILSAIQDVETHLAN